MLIREVIEQAKKMIRSRLEAEILLSHILKCSREYLIAHPEARVSRVAYRKLLGLCKKRNKGIPLAYIIQHKEFFGLDFYVDLRVLIPRPETELLVEEVIEKVKSKKLKVKSPLICDVGTGSGCIAIALSKHLPNVQITATDISRDALAVARKNAKRHHVYKRIKFVQSDLLENVIVMPSNHDNHVDIIVANLPYVPCREAHLVDQQVKKHEPKSALWGGQDGLKFLRQFLNQVKRLAHPPRYIVCEFGFFMKKEVQKLIESIFKKPRVVYKKDLSGHDRYFIMDLCSKNSKNWRKNMKNCSGN